MRHHDHHSDAIVTDGPARPRAIGGPPLAGDDPAAMPACPFVGRLDDPALVGTMPATNHRCYKPPSPHRVRSDIQGRFCLSARYQRCPVYRGVLAAPPGPSLGARLFQGGALRFLGTREGIAFVLFAMLIPAAIGIAFAVLDDDNSASVPTEVVTLTDITNQPGSNAIDPTLPIGAGEAAQAVEEAAVSEEITPAGPDAAAEPEVVAPDPNLTPREQLLAWTELTQHPVQSGDSLGAIAAEYGTTIEAIAVYNGISDINTIAIGQVLVVPIGFTSPLEIAQTSAGGEQAVVPDPPTDGVPDDAQPDDGATPDDPAVVEPPPAPPAPSDALLAWPDVVEWEVGPGDSLFLISIDFATSVDAIVALNGLDPATPLQVGQVLLVPQGFLQP